jgi:hypothetical protein
MATLLKPLDPFWNPSPSGATIGGLAVAHDHLVVAIHGLGEYYMGKVPEDHRLCSFQVWRCMATSHMHLDLQTVSMSHDGSVSAMLFVNDRLFTFGTDAALRVWDIFGQSE